MQVLAAQAGRAALCAQLSATTTVDLSGFRAPRHRLPGKQRGPLSSGRCHPSAATPSVGGVTGLAASVAALILRVALRVLRFAGLI